MATADEDDLLLNYMFDKLETKIFMFELKNKEVIEIYGKHNTGKTELLMDLMARFLLPLKWKLTEDLIVDLGKYSSSSLYKEPSQMTKAILINTDSKFNIQRLFVIMEERVKIVLNRLKLFSDENKALLQKFIRDCLKNLVVYQCYTNEQFIFSFSACEMFIQKLLLEPKDKETVWPIFIDSINSNYEIFDHYNRSNGLCDLFDHTEVYSVQSINKLLKNFNVCIISSRANLSYYNLKSLTEDYLSYSYQKWQKIVTKRIELLARQCENENPNQYLYRLSEIITKKDENANNLKTETKVIKGFSRFIIKNEGFTLFD